MKYFPLQRIQKTRFLFALDGILKITIGVVLGLALVEGILQVNPKLLWAGMGLPSPAAPSLTVQDFDVFNSDGDLFYWHRDLIRPLAAEDDRLAARVHYETDESGFPNPAPLPEKADIVILGRSFSMGAQSEAPWPRLVFQKTGMDVINLSQAGNEPGIKKQYWRQFGSARHPEWVIIEVLPSMDIFGFRKTSASRFLMDDLPFSILQRLVRHYFSTPAAQTSSNMAGRPYPLPIDIPGRKVELVFYSYYLSGLTVDEETLLASQDWVDFQKELLDLAGEIKATNACVMLLYVPTKENIYIPLAEQPGQLEPAVQNMNSWRLDEKGSLVETQNAAIQVTALQNNAQAARNLLQRFARANALAWADPSASMQQMALEGKNPFMEYDSHWSLYGHEATAQTILANLENATCP